MTEATEIADRNMLVKAKTDDIRLWKFTIIFGGKVRIIIPHRIEFVGSEIIAA